MTEIRALAQFIQSFSLEKAPPAVAEAARLCVLDTVGSALGAADDEMILKIQDVYCRLAGENPKVSIWGQGKKAPLFTAAFLNGLMGHRLELDDVHTTSKTHIGAVVIPAAWPLAEYLGKSGKDFLEAVICGYETMSRIGMGFGVSGHRNKGWHVTSTAGTFGAAAASAKLLGLDEDRTVYALGLAGTQSCGLWAFLGDGANSKVLHPARAAVSGLESAFLAQAGMTGAEHILDAKDGGLLAAMSDEHDISLVAKGLGEVYEILKLDNKPYPCCRSSHGSIDAALALKKEFNLTAADIEFVDVATYLVGYKQVGMSESSKNPHSPVEAKFSTPYTVACAILDSKVDVNSFLPSKIADPAVRELLQKVTVRPEERFTADYPRHWSCELTIKTRDGRNVSKLVKDASGSVASPLTAEQVKAKAVALSQKALGENTTKIAEQILQIDRLPALPDL